MQGYAPSEMAAKDLQNNGYFVVVNGALTI
jgi:hypothetical protein